MKDKIKFKAAKECSQYKELLHYTDFDVLTIILKDKTLKLNSIKNMNDKLERKRKGIEELADGFYVSSFCHCEYEIVPFWMMYGRGNNSRKVLLRFQNFASNFENVFHQDYGYTSDKKKIYFDRHNLFKHHCGNMSFGAINDPKIESRITIENVRMFDVDYRFSNDEVFTKEYKTIGKISFDNGETFISAPKMDVRTVGRFKTVHWKHEKETRILCQMSIIGKPFFDYFLMRFKADVFRGLKIVANPWVDDSFIQEIRLAIANSTLSEDIKSTIQVLRSELDGQIVLLD